MIITEISDDQQSSSERTFWGIKVLRKKPVTVRLPNNSFNCLHISQATAEPANSENMCNGNRTLVYVKCDGKNKILICSLGAKHTAMATLGLEFTGPYEMVFSLRGRREVHLVGHFYNRITLPANFVAPPIEKRREWERASKHLPIADEIEEENKGSEIKRKRKQGNKQLPSVEDIDGNNNGSEEGRKQKVENSLPIAAIAADNDGDTNEGEKKGEKGEEAYVKS